MASSRTQRRRISPRISTRRSRRPPEICSAALAGKVYRSHRAYRTYFPPAAVPSSANRRHNETMIGRRLRSPAGDALCIVAWMSPLLKSSTLNLALACLAVATAHAATIDVTSAGATPNEKADCAAALQKAIDQSAPGDTIRHRIVHRKPDRFEGAHRWTQRRANVDKPFDQSHRFQSGKAQSGRRLRRRGNASRECDQLRRCGNRGRRNLSPSGIQRGRRHHVLAIDFGRREARDVVEAYRVGE